MQQNWQIRGKLITLKKKNPWLMGVLNVTPDSFSDGNNYRELDEAVKQAQAMEQQGVNIIDIGGESTKPGAQLVSEEEELNRVIPVIKAIRQISNVYISIDTTKATVAQAAIEAGADIINDISGLEQDSGMSQIAVKYPQVALVVMHRQGMSSKMQQTPSYHDVVAEIAMYLQNRYLTLTNSGIESSRLCFDPGVGFGKKIEHNLALIKNLEEIRVGNCPLLLGVSRKSMFAHCLSAGATQAENQTSLNLREAPTAALTCYGADAGANIIRVHDVKLNKAALKSYL